MNVSICQCVHILQVHTLNLAEALANAGWKVQLLLVDVPTHLVEEELAAVVDIGVEVVRDARDVKACPSGLNGANLDITLKQALHLRGLLAEGLTAKAITKRIRRIFQVLREKARYWGPFAYESLYGADLLQRWDRREDKARCDLAIGIEIYGLLLAARIAKRAQCPIVYYSLELDSWRYVRRVESSCLRRLASKVLSKTALTIIQDDTRWESLRAGAGLGERAHRTLLPVSLARPLVAPTRAHVPLAIKSAVAGRKMVLLVGFLWKQRMTFELIEQAKLLPDGFVLVIHGSSFGDEQRLLQEKVNESSGRVIWSRDVMRREELEDLVVAAEVGLALYPDLDDNHRMTAHSSEKMALYAQCGVPVISFDYPSYSTHFSKYKSGVAVPSIDRIPEAVEQISRTRSAYSHEARRSYREIYHFQIHEGGVLKALSETAGSKAKRKAQGPA